MTARAGQREGSEDCGERLAPGPGCLSLARGDPERPAWIDAGSGRQVTYAELADRTGEFRVRWLRGRCLVAIAATSSLETLVAYLACLSSGYPVALLDPLDGALIEAYRPGLVVLGDEVSPIDGERPPLHPDLALLLSTSGSTGSRKLVRLSYRNLESNARAIVGYLGLSPDERAVLSLPLSYAYGLSVVHSHLLAGATLVKPPGPFLQPPFWSAVERYGVTSLAGVPYMYEVMLRLGIDPAEHRRLRTLTQAGGRLHPELALAFQRGVERFFVMYGQTEATARISYLPPDRLREKPGSVGRAIAEGQLEVGPGDELFYSGPNVMMGYAWGAGCLAGGDELQGRLRTGDLGRQDSEGFFYITGRCARFAKICGRRLDLDEVEALLERDATREAMAEERDGTLHVATTVPLAFDLAHRLQIPSTAVRLRTVSSLPRGPSGKKLRLDPSPGRSSLEDDQRSP